MSVYTKKIFAERLLALRGDMSNAVFAGRCGLNVQDIQRYVTGNATPNIDKLARIASHFGVSADWLLGNDGHSALALDPVQNPVLPTNLPQPRRVPVVGMAAAAAFDPALGCMGDLFANTDEEIICVLDQAENVFGLRISGDSMEPYLRDGDVVAVRDVLPATGDPCVAMLREYGIVCKRWYWRNGIIRLESTNPEGVSWEWSKETFLREQPIVWRFRIEGIIWRKHIFG